MKRLFVGGVNASGKIFNGSTDGLVSYLSTSFTIVGNQHEVTQEDYYLAIDYDPRELGQVVKLGIPKSRRCLVAFEPSAILPMQKPQHVERHFEKVIWIGREIRGEFFPWPQQSQLFMYRKPRHSGPVLISANKLSFERGELYSLRRRVVRKVRPLLVFGAQWQISFIERCLLFLKALAHRMLVDRRIPSVSNIDFLFTHREASVVADKAEAFSRASIALVIENSVEYCSEKVIDAMRHGCIPIYVGNQNALDSSLKSLVVSAEPSLASISTALERAKSINHDAWLGRAETALSSPVLWDRVSEPRVLERVASSIRDWANFER